MALRPTSPLRHGNQQGRVSTGLAPLGAPERRLLRLFEEAARVRYAARTADHYIGDARLFLAWLAGQGIGLKGLRPADVQRYASDLYAERKPDGRPFAVSTVAIKLIAVKTLCAFLQRRGFLLFDPAARVELPRTGRQLPRVILTEEEACRIVTAPRGMNPRALRDRAILETLYGTGLRVGELSALTPADVDTEGLAVRVVMGKGRKDRTVPLTPAAARALEAYLVHGRVAFLRARTVALLPQAPRWLFLGEKLGRRMARATVGRIVAAWAAKARVKKHVTCHVFRHSVATHLLRRGADIRQIQAFLGHRDLSTTERYTHVEISDLRRVVERAHPRGR